MRNFSLEFAKKMFLYSIISFIGFYSLGIVVLGIISVINTRLYNVIFLFFFSLWSILSITFSFIGYYWMIRIERSISKLNLIGMIISAFLLVYFSAFIILRFINYRIIYNLMNPIVILFGISIVLSLVWLILSYNRYRYLKNKMQNL